MTNRKLPFDLAKVSEIKAKYPTPFYIYDEAGIKKCVKDLKKAFSWNPGYKEFFAVKATPNPAIMKLLIDLGCGFDCASIAELTMCQKLMVRGDSIMFSSNDTTTAEYNMALKMNAKVNFDDVSHIDFIKANCGVPETASFRYNPGEAPIEANEFMGELKESKFGMPEAHIIEGIKKLKELGTKHFGLHAMLASCSLDEGYYPALAKELFELAVRIKEETGVTIEFVNMSGGVGIPYRPEEKAVDIAAIGEAVHKVYDEVFAGTELAPAIYTELGRYVTGPYGFLVSEVLHLKDSHKYYVGIDATACDLMRPAIYGAYHHIVVLGKEEAPNTITCDVTGSLCENNDKFAIDRELPEVEIGDIVAICDAGAHGHSMGYNYNGKMRCAEVLLRSNGKFELIRRRQTLDDYFATLDIFEEFQPLPLMEMCGGIEIPAQIYDDCISHMPSEEAE